MAEERRARSRMAVALKYEQGVDEAPKVVASGRGYIAERIVEVAREHRVPVVEDAALVAALMSVEVGSPIPPHLYEAVARVLAFVYSSGRSYERERSGAG